MDNSWILLVGVLLAVMIGPIINVIGPLITKFFGKRQQELQQKQDSLQQELKDNIEKTGKVY
jgi:hypothetical protein